MTELTFIWGSIGIIISTAIGGFFFLNKRLNELSDGIDISKDFSKQLVILVQDVHEIKSALIGNFDKKGLIGKFNDLERKVETMNRS